MKIVPLDPMANASPEALLRFLADCRSEADKAGRPLLVSISVEVDALDPLAVLESIFEAQEAHFYIEKPSEGVALAGAEVVLSHAAQGPGRMASCQAFVDTTLASTILVGAHAHAFGGPLFFTSFSFAEQTEEGEPFPAARVFVPRWQVGVSEGRTVATANLLVQPGVDPLPTAMRIWKAHAKFSSFSYAVESAAVAAPGAQGAGPEAVRPAQGSPQSQDSGPERKLLLSTTEVGGPGHYEQAVARALTLIGEGRFQKIVLARAQDLQASSAFHPLKVLNTLRQRYPDCFAFSLANERGQSFIGATPERLVRVDSGRLTTEALAGSARRGATASEDAALGGALLRDEKDLREHRCVVDSIVRRLGGLGLAVEHAERPTLRRLANVQHLHTPVRAQLPPGVRLLDVLARLHPTPAVGGSPREAAVPHIRELEAFPRGLYAGAIGWLDVRGNGEFCVGLRSALVEGCRARLYAGAGIVAGSEPGREHAETELKIRAMRDGVLQD